MLAALPSGGSKFTYGQKQTIFHQGDPADAVFFVEKGRIQICVVSAQGKEAVIATLGSGEFFGEGCLAGQPLHIGSAIALIETTIVRIAKATMVRALHDNPEFAALFTAFLLGRNIQSEAELVRHLFNSSEKRLARVLLLLSNLGKDGKMEKVIPKVNQTALAARVGTTRSRVNLFLNKFRKLGFIEYNGDLKVHSSLMTVLVHDAADAPAHRRLRGGKPARRPTKG
jgi:CRP/FNR family transcriptional regulator, cyclic AMP receptor protein